jgi:hypothetical protein
MIDEGDLKTLFGEILTSGRIMTNSYIPLQRCYVDITCAFSVTLLALIEGIDIPLSSTYMAGANALFLLKFYLHL